MSSDESASSNGGRHRDRSPVPEASESKTTLDTLFTRIEQQIDAYVMDHRDTNKATVCVKVIDYLNGVRMRNSV